MIQWARFFVSLIIDEGLGGWTYVKGSIKGSNQADNVKEETDVAAPDAELRGEGEFINAAAIDITPCISEADVRQADGAPREEIG